MDKTVALAFWTLKECRSSRFFIIGDSLINSLCPPFGDDLCDWNVRSPPQLTIAVSLTLPTRIQPLYDA